MKVDIENQVDDNINNDADDDMENKLKETEEEVKKQKKKKVRMVWYNNKLLKMIYEGVVGRAARNSSNDVDMFYCCYYCGLQGIISSANMIDSSDTSVISSSPTILSSKPAQIFIAR